MGVRRPEFTNLDFVVVSLDAKLSPGTGSSLWQKYPSRRSNIQSGGFIKDLLHDKC